MRLPEPRDGDIDWSRLREHDLQELWNLSIRPHVASAYAARLDLLLHIIARHVKPPSRVLDVGCAQGTLGLLLAEDGYRVSLLDVRSVNIEYARARHEKGEVKYFVGFLGPDTPPDQDYDLVTCTEVLEHVREPGILLQELANKVKPGGCVCVTTPNADYLLSQLPSFSAAAQVIIDEAEQNSLDGDAHRFLYKKEELVALARGAGLRIESHGFFLPAWVEGHAKSRYLHRLLYHVRDDILRLPATLPSQGLARRLCSSQWMIIRSPGLP